MSHAVLLLQALMNRSFAVYTSFTTVDLPRTTSTQFRFSTNMTSEATVVSLEGSRHSQYSNRVPSVPIRLVSSSQDCTRGDSYARLSSRSPGPFCPATFQEPWHIQNMWSCHFDSHPSLGECNFGQPSLLHFRPGRGHLPGPQAQSCLVSVTLGEGWGGYPLRSPDRTSRYQT